MTMKLPIPPDWSEIYEEKGRELHFRNFIDGHWRHPGGEAHKAIRNPFDDSLVGYVPECPSEGVEVAIEAGWRARAVMRNMPAVERIELFHRAADLTERHEDLFVECLLKEAGKTRSEAKSEVGATVARMRLVAEEARKIFGEFIPGDWSEKNMQEMAIVLREPRGVVLCIAPFNYPLYITASKIVPALLAGNSVVVKLPSADSISFLLFARVLQEAGFPGGAINVITPSGRTLGEHVSDQRIAAISFTGSTSVGNKIAENAGMKHLHMELGGNGAAIVTGKADLDLAAECIAHGAFGFSGQRCDAVSRVFVTEDVADALVDKLSEEVADYASGDPADPYTKVGPLIDSDAVEHVASLVADALDRGARHLHGGEAQGSVFPPTLLDAVPTEAKVMCEETFGPVIPVHRVKTLDEALEKADDTPYGLDSCVFTNDFYEAWKAARSLKDGEVTINDFPSHGIGYFPFGGTGASGIGREGVGQSIEEMTRLKTVVFNLEPAGLGKKRQVSRI